jgi:hypothetical protein
MEKRAQPNQSTNRNFYDLTERVLGCVVGFCDTSWRTRLSALPEWSYHWPHDPKWEFIPGSREEPRLRHGYYRLAYLRLCIDFLSTGRFNVPLIQAFIRELDNDPGTKDDRVEAHNCLWALMGLADQNAGFFDQTLKKLSDLHGGLASSGRYQTACEGLIFMNGVFLRSIAFQQGMPVQTFSPYLPTG